MGKITQLIAESALDYGHPSEDASKRFPEDQLLRQHGFKIYKRKEGEQPIWERDGRRFFESVALKLVDAARLD